jgi:hypothetical protein
MMELLWMISLNRISPAFQTFENEKHSLERLNNFNAHLEKMRFKLPGQPASMRGGRQ